MDGLRDQNLPDVLSDPSPDLEDDLQEPETADVEELVVKDSEDVDKDSEDVVNEGDKGRDINNLHREFSRKQEELRERMDRQFSTLMGELTGAIRQGSLAKPDKQGGNTLDEMSIEQLKAMRAQVPEEQTATFDDYLQNRVITEEVDRQVGKFTSSHKSDLARQASNATATQRYPDLNDETSTFWSAVDQELRTRGAGYAQVTPTAVLDVANEIAQRQGVKPNTSRRRMIAQPAAKRGGKPVAPDEVSTLTDETYARIRDRLEGAIPGVKFDKKNIQERHKLYKDNQSLFIR